MRTPLQVEIASPPNRERLVACLMVGKVQWGEINQESGELEVEIYPQRDGQPWKFAFDKLIAALQNALERLVRGESSVSKTCSIATMFKRCRVRFGAL